MRHFFGLLSVIFFVIAAIPVAQAACALSHAPLPRGEIGLQLFQPMDEFAANTAKDLGIKWLRLELYWNRLEPKLGQFDWSFFDSVMGRYASNYQVMVLFNHPPPWSQSLSKEDFAKASAHAIGQAAGRYKGRVHAWEVFNEPNLAGYGWPDGADSLQRYSMTLTAVGSAIRDADKDVLIVTGGLSPMGSNPANFLSTLVKNTPADCYDVVGLHPYGEVDHLGRILRNGKSLTNKPFWFTELGAAPEQQENSLRQVFAQRDQIGLLFWFTDRDWGRYGEHYGLMDYKGRQRSSYDVFKTFQRKVAEP